MRVSGRAFLFGFVWAGARHGFNFGLTFVNCFWIPFMLRWLIDFCLATYLFFVLCFHLITASDCELFLFYAFFNFLTLVI